MGEIENFSSDDGFKIKKIKKKAKTETDYHEQAKRNKKKKAQELYNYISIEELDIIKCYDELLEMSNTEDSVLTIMRQVLTAANKAIANKKHYFQKKWYHLKSANLTELEYRTKQKCLQKDEIEEVNEIKEDILNKLASSKIKGFENKDMLLEKAIKDNLPITQDQLSNNKSIELDDDSWLNYKQNQMVLLEKLLNSDYFVQKTDGEWGPDGKYLGLEGGFGRESGFMMDPEQAGNMRGGFGKNKDEFEVGESYNRREKRAINIKLSRYIGRINDSNETPRDIENYLSE